MKSSLSIFNITDLHNNPILYKRPKLNTKPFYILQDNICFSKQPAFVRKLITTDISHLLTNRYIVIRTNCPLFVWLAYNKRNYQALVNLGFLEDKPFESANPAIHGFNLLSYVMKNHVIFHQKLVNTVKDRMKELNNGNCISIHVRMGAEKSDFKRDKKFLTNNDLMKFTNCPVISQYVHTPIFLSSDSSFAKSIIVREMKSNKVVSFSIKAIHSKRVSFTLENKGAVETFLDLMTLGSCKELIGTYSSTFTILASSLIGKLPYLVSRQSVCKLPTNYFYL